MNNNIQETHKTEISKKFQWRDKNGNYHYPSDMETRHLFYVIRMIWNHSMPVNARIEPYVKYRFGNFYTEQYMKQAIINICRELSQRIDFDEKWVKDLNFMRSVFLQEYNIYLLSN